MAMTRLLGLSLALWWSCSAQAQILGDYFNGEHLQSYLSSDNESQRSAAMGYVAGILDMHVVMVSSYSAPPLFCRPNGVSRQEARDVVKRYIEKHPEALQVFAADVITRALGEAFPCAK